MGERATVTGPVHFLVASRRSVAANRFPGRRGPTGCTTRLGYCLRSPCARRPSWPALLMTGRSPVCEVHLFDVSSSRPTVSWCTELWRWDPCSAQLRLRTWLTGVGRVTALHLLFDGTSFWERDGVGPIAPAIIEAEAVVGIADSSGGRHATVNCEIGQIERLGRVTV